MCVCGGARARRRALERANAQLRFEALVARAGCAADWLPDRTLQARAPYCSRRGNWGRPAQCHARDAVAAPIAPQRGGVQPFACGCKPLTRPARGASKRGRAQHRRRTAQAIGVGLGNRLGTRQAIRVRVPLPYRPVHTHAWGRLLSTPTTCTTLKMGSLRASLFFSVLSTSADLPLLDALLLQVDLTS